MEMTRRHMFAAASAATAMTFGRSARAEIAKGSPSTGSFMLELGGQFMPVKSIEGGAPVGVVVSSSAPSPNAPHFREKHLSGVKYEPIAIEAPFGSARPLFEWIGTAWRGTRTQANGSLITVDVTGRPLARREFVGAFIVETVVPTLDATSRDPAFVTVRLTPEHTSDGTPPATLPASPRRPTPSLSSNFRLSIGGLDCHSVSKIDSFTVKQQSNLVEFTNLRIEFSRASLESWRTWFRSFVIGGNSTPGNEKTGTLELLSPNLTTVLATIRFYNLGIFRLDDAPADPRTAVTRVVAELYCERMELTMG